MVKVLIFFVKKRTRSLIAKLEAWKVVLPWYLNARFVPHVLCDSWGFLLILAPLLQIRMTAVICHRQHTQLSLVSGHRSALRDKFHGKIEWCSGALSLKTLGRRNHHSISIINYMPCDCMIIDDCKRSFKAVWFTGCKMRSHFNSVGVFSVASAVLHGDVSYFIWKTQYYRSREKVAR